MTFPDQIDGTMMLLQKVARLKGLSSDERYMRSFIDAGFRFFVEFKDQRTWQTTFVLEHLPNASQSELRTSNEFCDFERKCVLALECVYTYMHRAFTLVRVTADSQPKIDVRGHFGKQEKAQEWLQNFQFVSEFRSKVIEHAAGNLDFYTGWGQHFDRDDPYEFRLWILDKNLGEILKTDDGVIKQIAASQALIKTHMPLISDRCPELPYSFCYDFLEGARFLPNSQIIKICKKVLFKTGCISHPPDLLLATLHNLCRFVFAEHLARSN